MKIPFRSKEISWLSFNARVLQEGASSDVPLMERIKFLGIYSSNMDEFFRVRVATLRRLASLGEQWKSLHMPDPNVTLKTIATIVGEQAEDFNVAYGTAMVDLEANGIRVVNEEQVPKSLHSHVIKYFREKVSPHINPIMLKHTAKLPKLRDAPMYLAVRLTKADGKGRAAHSLIEIPGILPRFIALPKSGKTQLVMYLDDIIRFGLYEIFGVLPYDTFESYAIKFTRDSELEFDDDFTESFYEKLEDGLKARQQGLPVRANFDSNFPKTFLNLVLKKLNISAPETLYPGAKYHNRRDLLSFPSFGRDDLKNPPTEEIIPRGFRKSHKKSIFAKIRKRDLLLHIPYHPFRFYIDLLQEASIDPFVQTIQMTQYRLAKKSCVAKALMAAARNGKKVSVLVEPQARFDEEANIAWASEYRAAGVRVVLGVPGLKVHSKLLLINRREHGVDRAYTILGTGNFNEDTTGIFADHLLFTAHPEIAEDAAAIFRFAERSYRPPLLKHLVAAPMGLRVFIRKKIRAEIEAAKAGKKAGISLKINNLSDEEVVGLLYEASQAGVKIRIIARSMFSLITGDGPGESIEAIGIVDKYLEHSRLLIFENDGEPEVYLSSADFLPRNFDSRIETVFPIYDKKLKEQLFKYFEIQWSDNVKARILDADLSNEYRKSDGKPIRAQYVIEDYLRNAAR